MSAHEWTPDPDDVRRCRVCGCTGHCAGCNEGTGGYGHYVTDAAGGFLRCQEPDRYEAKQAVAKAKRETEERQELRRLAAKYPDEIGALHE